MQLLTWRLAMRLACKPRHNRADIDMPDIQQACLHKQMHVQGNPKFLEIVTNWQRKLGTVDVVLNTWLDVQKKWQALESIFVGSADIRVQLPEDSKRFDVINADFQVLWCSLLVT